MYINNSNVRTGGEVEVFALIIIIVWRLFRARCTLDILYAEIIDRIAATRPMMVGRYLRRLYVFVFIYRETLNGRRLPDICLKGFTRRARSICIRIRLIDARPYYFERERATFTGGKRRRIF